MSKFLKPQSPLRKGEAYIYPLTTADQVILEDNTRLNAALEDIKDKIDNIDFSNLELGDVAYAGDTLNSATTNIKTLFEDKEKTSPIFPITKINAVSDDNGVELNTILNNMVHAEEYSSDIATAPVDADTLGGRPANEYVLKSEIGDMDISGSGGGSGSVQPETGSDVSFTQILTSGTKIGSITIDGASTDIYAPDKVVADVALSSTSTNPVQNKVIYNKFNTKQDKLTFDSTPTENSTNPVASGGVYTEVNSAKMIANMAMPGSLKWDGVVGGREQLIMGEEPIGEGITMRQAFVHVSDYVPEILTLMMEGAPAEERILSVLFSTSGVMFGEGAEEIQVQVADDMFIMGEVFLYVPTDGYSMEGIVFPKKGWYFISISYVMGDMEFPMMYVNGLQILGLSFPDTNGGSDKYFESIETEEVYKLLRDASDEGVSTDGMPLYKVSSEVPPISVFSNGYKIINGNSGDSYEVTAYMTTEYIIKDNGAYTLCAPSTNSDGIESPFPLIFVIPYDGYDLNGVTISTAGMYTFVTEEIILIGKD